MSLFTHCAVLIAWIGETHVAKNSSGSESRVSAFLSCSPSKTPIKGVVLSEMACLEIWLRGAKADDPDASKAITKTSSVIKKVMDSMVPCSVTSDTVSVINRQRWVIMKCSLQPM